MQKRELMGGFAFTGIPIIELHRFQAQKKPLRMKWFES
jgi:hypothetical protein